MGWLIRVGEWISFRKCDWNHMFIIDRVDNLVPYVLQATLKGVTDSVLLEEIAPGGKYVTFAPPDGVTREGLLYFARKQVGLRYGYWTIVAIAIDIVTWQWFPAFRGARKPSWICSALGCEALRYGGWLHEWLDIYTVTPAQAYEALVKTL
jgi:hypothetical protein